MIGKHIYEFLKLEDRVAEITRKTNEMDIYIKLILMELVKVKLIQELHFLIIC